MFLRFLGEGPLNFQYLTSLGDDLYILRSKGLRNKKLIIRLKNKENFSGADFEVRFLAHFIRNGFAIERDYPSGKGNKNCDLRVSKGSGASAENVFIEITRPEDVCDENKRRYTEGMQQLLSSLNEGYERHIKDSLKEFEIGRYSLSEEAEIKKIIPIIEKKAGQLPDSGPGLIILSTPRGLNPESSSRIFENEVDMLLEKLPQLSAIVFSEGSFVECRIHYQINIFYNPKAKINISNSETIKAIENFT